MGRWRWAARTRQSCWTVAIAPKSTVVSRAWRCSRHTASWRRNWLFPIPPAHPQRTQGAACVLCQAEGSIPADGQSCSVPGFVIARILTLTIIRIIGATALAIQPLERAHALDRLADSLQTLRRDTQRPQGEVLHLWLLFDGHQQRQLGLCPLRLILFTEILRRAAKERREILQMAV